MEVRWWFLWAGSMGILLAACGGGSSSNPSPSPTPSPGGGGMPPTITIASDAVSPKNITVARGSQVTFVNNDSRPHEMYSDPHPEHTDCPEINDVGFLNPGDKPIIWRGPMLHQIVRQFLGLVEWGQLDYLIVDLPPGTGDIALSLVQTVPLTGAVVVSTPSDVSLQDARKAVEMFRQMKVDIVGVVENMSYFVCPHCQHEVDIFSRGGAEKMAEKFGVAFLGSIQLDPEVRKSGDGGTPVVLEGENSPHAKSIFEFARKVVERAGEIKANATGSVIQIQ